MDFFVSNFAVGDMWQAPGELAMSGLSSCSSSFDGVCG